jgi:hypothetical protein
MIVGNKTKTHLQAVDFPSIDPSLSHPSWDAIAEDYSYFAYILPLSLSESLLHLRYQRLLLEIIRLKLSAQRHTFFLRAVAEDCEIFVKCTSRIRITQHTLFLRMITCHGKYFARCTFMLPRTETANGIIPGTATTYVRN